MCRSLLNPPLSERGMARLDDLLALSLIEQGERAAPLDRAVLMAATFGDGEAALVADLALDRRDRMLIDARITAFGGEIAFFARCPHCAEGNEAGFDLTALPPAVTAETVAVEVAGRRIALRAPTSRAVAAAVLAGDPGLLHEHCAGARIESPGAVEAALAGAFPLLDVRFEMTCGACSTPFSARFDIAEWLWREIGALAERMIYTIHRLARAYGWSERDILALSPARRMRYLALLAA